MRLYPMRVATSQAGLPVPCYLIRVDDGTNVLVDTGVPPEGLRGDAGAAAWVEDARGGVARQLAALGLTPADIAYVVCTHFDPDHAGGHDQFPAATFVAQRRAYEAARASEEPRFARTRAHWDRPELRYRLVDGDVTLLPGLDLIETGGHAPGHQTVLARLPATGPTLLTIDAIPLAAMRDPATRPLTPYDMDAAATRASTRKLVELAERERVALTIYGHDAAQWRTLRLLPDYYA